MARGVATLILVLAVSTTGLGAPDAGVPTVHLAPAALSPDEGDEDQAAEALDVGSDLVDLPGADLVSDQLDVDDADPVADPPPVNCCWTAADVLAVRATASPRARCVIDGEVGGVGYNPWAVGKAGELGPVQLHPRGLLPDYLRWSGGAAPQNPRMAVAYLEHMLSIGQGRHWTDVRNGRC